MASIFSVWFLEGARTPETPYADAFAAIYTRNVCGTVIGFSRHVNGVFVTLAVGTSHTDGALFAGKHAFFLWFGSKKGLAILAVAADCIHCSPYRLRFGIFNWFDAFYSPVERQTGKSSFFRSS